MSNLDFVTNFKYNIIKVESEKMTPPQDPTFEKIM